MTISLCIYREDERQQVLFVQLWWRGWKQQRSSQGRLVPRPRDSKGISKLPPILLLISKVKLEVVKRSRYTIPAWAQV